MRRLLVVVAVAAVALAASSVAAGVSAQGVVTGRVWLEPKTMQCFTVPCLEPALGVSLIFSQPGTRRVVTTNGEGRYRITLPPGLYRVTGPGLMRQALDVVRVGAGQRRVLDLRVDARYAHPDERSTS